MANGEFSQYPYIPQQRQVIPPGTTDFASNAFLALLLGIQAKADENRRLQYLGQAQQQSRAQFALEGAGKLAQIAHSGALTEQARAATELTRQQTQQAGQLFEPQLSGAQAQARTARIEADNKQAQINETIASLQAATKDSLARLEQTQLAIAAFKEDSPTMHNILVQKYNNSLTEAQTTAQNLQLANYNLKVAEATFQDKLDEARDLHNAAKTKADIAQAELLEYQATTDYRIKLRSAELLAKQAETNFYNARIAQLNIENQLTQSGKMTPNQLSSLMRLKLQQESAANVQMRFLVDKAIIPINQRAQNPIYTIPVSGNPAPIEADIRTALTNLLQSAQISGVDPEQIASMFLAGVNYSALPFRPIIDAAKKRYLQSQQGLPSLPSIQGTPGTEPESQLSPLPNNNPNINSALVELIRIYRVTNDDDRKSKGNIWWTKWRQTFPGPSGNAILESINAHAKTLVRQDAKR